MCDRLDIVLQKKGLVQTRSKAQNLIKNGFVFINGEVCKKPSYSVNEADSITIDNSFFVYVSRSGVKLKFAIDTFRINLNSAVCLDIGASTGGFSDCMLKEGAKVVYSVDVGKGQLHNSLKNNKRLISFENTDIRDFKIDILFDFIAIDVSFISLRHILPVARKFLKEEGAVASLIKPQFEVGPGVVKNGIVKNNNMIDYAIENIKNFAENLGFIVNGICQSPILGKKGNKEFLIYLTA